MKGLDDVTIYTFLFPIDQLHPDSARKSAIIWCAPDRAKAWDEYFATGKLPNNKGDCATPIAQTAQLGEKLHVTATPTLVFADGSMIPGAIPPDRAREGARPGRGGSEEARGGEEIVSLAPDRTRRRRRGHSRFHQKPVHRHHRVDR